MSVPTDDPVMRYQVLASEMACELEALFPGYSVSIFARDKERPRGHMFCSDDSLDDLRHAFAQLEESPCRCEACVGGQQEGGGQ